jgi:hypothetical protein
VAAPSSSLALAPRAALYAYGLAFLSAILTGYAIDRWGMGVGRDERRHDRVGSRDLQEPRLEHARG